MDIDVYVGRIDVWVDMGGWVERSMCGCADGSMCGWVELDIDGWVDGWIHVWVGSSTFIQTPSRSYAFA
jgi:hypothetical protein